MISGGFEAIASLFGGGGDGGGYSSPNLPTMENNQRSFIGNRSGAKKIPKKDANGKVIPGEYEYDYSDAGAPKTVADAKKGYDFSGFDKAAGKMGDYGKFNEEYKSGYSPKSFTSGYTQPSYSAAKFNYENLPEQFAKDQYNLGAKDLRRDSAGQLEQLREAVGTRRPGLLMKAGADSQRDVREKLAELQTGIRTNMAEKGTDLKVQQQRDQAAENFQKAGFDDSTARFLADEKYKEAGFGEEQERFKADEGYKGYGSRAENESKTADERFRRDSGAVDAAGKKIGLEEGVTGSERDYQDKAMEWLQNLFGISVGADSDKAGRKTSERGQSLNFLSGLFG